jgi:hypothetical protein
MVYRRYRKRSYYSNEEHSSLVILIHISVLRAAPVHGKIEPRRKYYTLSVLNMVVLQIWFQP